jgi:hypothetical protein
MGFIRKRKLPSGKIRWQVIWDADVAEASEEIVDRPRMTAMFDTHAEAKTKLASVELEKPKPSTPFADLTDHFLKYFEQLVKKGQREGRLCDSGRPGGPGFGAGRRGERPRRELTRRPGALDRGVWLP